VKIQRWISDQQARMVTEFLKPLMDANCGWLVYEIDDEMFDGTILPGMDEKLIHEKYG